MKKIIMSVTIILSVFLFSCGDDSEQSAFEKIVSKCKNYCEISNCTSQSETEIERCKNECEIPTKSNCTEECMTQNGATQEICDSYCSNMIVCSNKMEENCISEYEAVTNCIYDCVDLKDICTDEQSCTNTECQNEGILLNACASKIPECIE